MALNARELELIIIARDHASSTIARVGGALTILGGGITHMGVAWGRELGEMTNEAITFSHDAALAFTQMFDKTGASADDINSMMERVARSTARPIEEMGDALFDVFSSLDVNVPEAEKILLRVGEAAVAGNADMRAAMVPTIGMMNAFKLGADDIDRILDVQFETVRKGIITYEEFTANIGKVIPASVAAGQSMEEMGAAYSFLTRQGVNAAMSSTSVARAMELLTRPNTIANLEEIGVQVRDQEGEFLGLSEIVGQLGKRMDHMTGPERKQAFQDIFGTGTIQARRFFDLALANWEEYLELQGDFENSAGAMQEAYDIMFDEPLTKLQLMKNRWEILRKEIGDHFIPILEDKLLPILDRLFDMWERLTDEQKDTIAEWLGWGSIATTVFGIMTTIAGLITLVVGIWKAFGSTIGAILVGGLKVFGIIGLIAGVAYLVWQNWDKIVQLWEQHVLPVLEDIWAFVKPLVEELIRVGEEVAIGVWEELVNAWEELKSIGEELLDSLDIESLEETWRRVWERMPELVEAAFEAIKTIIITAGEVIKGVIRTVVAVISWIWINWGPQITTIIQTILNTLGRLFEGWMIVLEGLMVVLTGILTGDFEKIKEGLSLIWEGLWNNLVAIVEGFRAIIDSIFSKIVDWFLNSVWEPFTETISEVWETVWNAVKDFFVSIWESDIVQFLVDIVGIFYEIFRIAFQTVYYFWLSIWEKVAGFFSRVWNNIKDAATVAWNLIKTTATVIWNAITDKMEEPVRTFRGWVKTTWHTIKSTAENIWNAIRDKANEIWDKIRAALMDPIQKAKEKIGEWIDAIIGFLQNLWDKAQEYADKIRNALSKLNPAEWFSPPLTQQVAAGFATMRRQMLGDLAFIESQTLRRVSNIREEMSKLAQMGSSLGPREVGFGGNGSTVYNYIDIHTQARSGEEIYDDLSWRLRTR